MGQPPEGLKEAGPDTRYPTSRLKHVHPRWAHPVTPKKEEDIHQADSKAVVRPREVREELLARLYTHCCLFLSSFSLLSIDD
jgi:hypothetical protein